MQDHTVSDADGSTTTNHNDIQNWVETRGGYPVRVNGAGNNENNGSNGSRVGQDRPLRIAFNGREGDEHVTRISWDEFFTLFEEHDLALRLTDGDAVEERFSDVVDRDAV